MGNEVYRKTVSLRCRLWINSDGKTFLGEGRALLLEKIDEYGSIKKAAESLKMSYKQAWDLIQEMNSCLKEPLVITVRGGKDNGGTKLTETGRKSLILFKNIQEDVKHYLKKHSDYKELEKLLS